MPDNHPKIAATNSATTTTTAAPSTGTAAPLKPQTTDETTHKHRGHLWIWIVAIIVLAVGGLIYYRKRQSAAQAAKAKAALANRSVPITTGTVTQGPIGVYINALGAVTPVYTATSPAAFKGKS